MPANTLFLDEVYSLQYSLYRQTFSLQYFCDTELRGVHWLHSYFRSSTVPRNSPSAGAVEVSARASSPAARRGDICSLRVDSRVSISHDLHSPNHSLWVMLY